MLPKLVKWFVLNYKTQVIQELDKWAVLVSGEIIKQKLTKNWLSECFLVTNENDPSYLSAKIKQHSNETGLKSVLCVEGFVLEGGKILFKKVTQVNISNIYSEWVTRTVEAKPILKRIAAESMGTPLHIYWGDGQ